MDWLSVEHYAQYGIGERLECGHGLPAILMWSHSKDHDTPPKCRLLWGCPKVHSTEWCRIYSSPFVDMWVEPPPPVDCAQEILDARVPSKYKK